MNKPTLGVHLIIKDEAELLSSCLESVAGADEIVIVDTGSSDGSVAIAEAYGAKVLHTEWTDDFAAARNCGLQQAATDWILVLDADERLKTPLDTVRKMLQNIPATAFTVQIENWLGHRPEEILHHRMIRLFRNGEGYRYSGKIHEGIDAAIIGKHGTVSIGHSDIGIVHLGYLPDIMAVKNKAARNERLLRHALEEEPDDDFYSYNLAVTCCQSGRLEEAEELLSRTLYRAPLQISYRPSMVRDLCKIRLAAGKMKAVDALLAGELLRYSDYPDLHYIQGESRESQGLAELAVQSYQLAEALHGHPEAGGKYVSEHGITSFRPLYRMGTLALQSGKPEEAARLFHRALQHHPLYAPALLGIVSVFQRLDVPDTDIAVLLMQLLPPEQPAARAAIIEALYAAEAYAAIAELPREQFPLEQAVLIPVISSWIATGTLESATVCARENRLRLSTGSGDPALLMPLWRLEALSRWAQKQSLQEDDLAAAPQDQRDEWRWINRQLTEQAAASTPAFSNPALAGLLATLIPLAVNLHLYPLATALADLPPGHRAALAAAMYREGRLQEAGTLLIDLAQAPEKDGTISFYIGEMLFDKAHYAEAAGWFRQALEQPANEQAEAARTGLAICYLQLAAADLRDAVNSFGKEYTQGPLLEDLAAIHSSIDLLNRTPWHTVWSWRQQQGGTRP